MLNIIRRITGVAGLSLIILLPLIFTFHALYPWKEGIAALEQQYPDQSYIRLGGSTTWSLNGKVKKQTYLVLPENKAVALLKRDNQSILVEESSEGIWHYIFGIIFAIGIFVFFGVPGLRDLLKK
jgi:hypothetical protein